MNPGLSGSPPPCCPIRTGTPRGRGRLSQVNPGKVGSERSPEAHSHEGAHSSPRATPRGQDPLSCWDRLTTGLWLEQAETENIPVVQHLSQTPRKAFTDGKEGENYEKTGRRKINRHMAACGWQGHSPGREKKPGPQVEGKHRGMKA